MNSLVIDNRNPSIHNLDGNEIAHIQHIFVKCLLLSARYPSMIGGY